MISVNTIAAQAVTAEGIAAQAIRRVNDTSVPTESRISISDSGDAITLEVADLGAISASAVGCVAVAPTPVAHDRLAAIGEDWALGQWLAFNGVNSFHGATLERDGFGFALIGPPRAGTSLTALALTRRGWKLISDGTCPLVIEDSPSTSEGANLADASQVSQRLVALPGRTHIQVDRLVTASFPPEEPFADAGTPRGRSDIMVKSTGPHRIDRIISIVPSNVRRDGVVVPGDRDGGDPPQILRATAIVGDALRAANLRLADSLTRFCERATQLAPLDAALVPAGKANFVFSPRQIADLIDGQVAALMQSTTAGDRDG